MTVAPPDSSTQTPADSVAGTVVRPLSAWWVLIAGVVGLVASMTLTVEKIRLLGDSSYTPSCNFNPVLSCGSVMITPQASVLGFPNPLIGIVAFTVVTVTGVLAVTKVPLPQWYWVGLTLGTLAGAGFVHWLIFQSLYRIGALCPYCMVVWAITIPLLVVLASIANTTIRVHKILQALHQWRWTLTALWFIGLIVLIFIRFQNYWSTFF